MIKTIIGLSTILVIAIAAYFFYAMNYQPLNGSSITEKIENKSPELETAQDITIRGTLECLPKSGDGPQTMECAFGLKDENGRFYGLNDPEWKFLIGPAMNTKVTVTGKLKDKNSGDKYNTIGTIEITNLEK
jgi:hypothetical protein